MTFPNRRKLVCTLYIFPLRKFTRLMSFRNPRRLRDFDPQLFRYTIFKVQSKALRNGFSFNAFIVFGDAQKVTSK